VYRGATAASQGWYIFGDYVRNEIYALTSGGGVWDYGVTSSASQFGRVVLYHDENLKPASFAQDHDGELYVLGMGNNTVSRLSFSNSGSTSPTKQQVSCVSELNGIFVKVANTRSAQVRSCVARGAVGKLAMGETVDMCVDDDPKGALAKIRAKTEALDTALCSALPPMVGYAGADAGLDAAIAAEAALGQDVLGDILDAGVVKKATDKVAAGCQRAVLKALAVCQAARRSEFLRCKRIGLKADSLSSSAVLAGCLDFDPRSRVLKACDPASGKVATEAIAKACAAKGVDFATVFPGCGASDAGGLASCLETAGCVRNCELFNAADALGIVDCAAVCPP
jgi:hypothetical protein